MTEPDCPKLIPVEYPWPSEGNVLKVHITRNESDR